MTRIASRSARPLAAVALALSLAAAGAQAGQDGAAAAAMFKDLDIRQAPMARIAASPTSEAGGASSETAGKLSVRASLDRADSVYKDGEKLVLTVSTTEDAYVWVFDTGTSGKVHQIFPNRYEKNNFVRAGAPVSIPGADSKYDLAVSHPRGAELITVIASKDDTPLTRDMIDRETGAGPFLALRGTASSVAKDLSVTLRNKKKEAWARDHRVILIR